MIFMLVAFHESFAAVGLELGRDQTFILKEGEQ